nr:hypothetical protein KPHV_08350 [Kitasatospora purpeofusca]
MTAYPLTIVTEYGGQEELAPYVQNVHSFLMSAAIKRGVPDLAVTAVLTGDLTTSIRNLGETDFAPERLGGAVAGKTIPAARDYSRASIVLDTSGAVDPIEFVHLVAHELGHALIGRLRAAAGTRPPQPTGHPTLQEAVAIMAYQAADEYRCDLISNIVLEQVMTSETKSG